MPLALNSGGLTHHELEKLRLLLSVFQDGIGMLSTENTGSILAPTLKRKVQQAQFAMELWDDEKKQRSLPGWRDFERAVALAFEGTALESKAIVDVVLPLKEGAYYGVSCKMRGELNRAVAEEGRVNIEVSNSAGKFWDYVLAQGITRENYRSPENAAIVGKALFALVEQWHNEVSLEQGGVIDIAESSYLVLQYNSLGKYRLYQYPLKFPDAEALTWSFPMRIFKDKAPREGRRLVGQDKAGGIVIEWYEYSGGQLKYYPLASEASWASNEFELEPLPRGTKHGVLSRVEEYFPELWAKANQNE